MEKNFNIKNKQLAYTLEGDPKKPLYQQFTLRGSSSALSPWSISSKLSPVCKTLSQEFFF
jgi:hypothetical protein